jgi:hypothetical protein
VIYSLVSDCETVYLKLSKKTTGRLRFPLGWEIQEDKNQSPQPRIGITADSWALLLTLYLFFPTCITMKLFIECFRADGSQILGNLDGQAVIHTVNYRRTTAYKRIKQIVKNSNHMGGKVHSAKIVTEQGTVLETVD